MKGPLKENSCFTTMEMIPLLKKSISKGDNAAPFQSNWCFKGVVRRVAAAWLLWKSNH